MAINCQSWIKLCLKCVFLILCVQNLWIPTNGATQQTFDTTPTDTEVNPEEIAKLACVVRNRHGRCHWLLKRDPESSQKVLERTDGKYEYDENPASGDCSISILKTSLERDDGLWECQVTTSSLDLHDISSNPVKLTVRHAPDPPMIEHGSNNYGNIRYSTGENFVAEADKQSKFTCVSRRGNPPAILKWFIDNTEITANSFQRNESDLELAKTFRASSSLTYTFQKEHHGKKLKCIALHPAYPTGSMDVTVSLNISYKPVVKLEGSPQSDLAEGDRLTMKCTASANPPATTVWEKSGTLSFKETIEFNPIKKEDAGVYSCSAKNSLGDSNKITVMLDVKFPPRVIEISPPSYTAVLYQSVNFRCSAEGNPTPRFSWLQNVQGQTNTWQHRGTNSTLFIQNATYSYQGRYICEVTNLIGGKEFKHQSNEVDLDIVGPPQYLREASKLRDKMVVERDEDAIIGVLFCADPTPTRMFWEWGSVKIDMGDSLARYMSKPLIREDLPKDCYEARLIIQNVESSDARKYTFYVENPKGFTNFETYLQVKEPVTMSAVIGIVVGCIVVVVIVIVVVFYLLKKERCFIRTQGFHPESENSSQRLSDELHHNGRSPSKDRAIPPDALYTDVQAIRHYENLKSSPDDKRGGDGIVYADLDLPALKSEKPKLNKSNDRIEYAEIQFKPSETNNKEEP